MNLKKFEELAGKWLKDAWTYRLPPTTPGQEGMAAKAIRCSDELSRLISDTEDEMGVNGPEDDGEFCLCDGCGLPIEPTRMFHGDRCLKIYAKAHAKAHGKENEDEA